jgi:hypothetical protein
MYQWGNATGDPEMYGGYLLDPKSIFSAFKSDDLGERLGKLLVETDQEKRYAGYQDVRPPAGAAMDEIRQRLDPAAKLRAEGMRFLSLPSPLAGEEGAHRASDGKVRGDSPYRDVRRMATSPLTLPVLRMGPFPLPQGEREIARDGSQ